MVVDSDAAQQRHRLQQILVQGTRFSLGFVVSVATALIILADPLIHAWLGARASEVAGAIPVLQVLAIAVAIRVGGATGTTILKGAGRHRMLAFVNLGTGIVNVALSAALIQRYGLVGVAFGTLAPIAVATTTILWPAACRRVELPLAAAVRRAVLPALWPVLPAAALLLGVREFVPPTISGVLLEAAVAVLVYVSLFIGVAVGRTDRALYVSKMRELIRREPRESGTPSVAQRVSRVVAGGR
jgi:O-antigen/teichoic acid export membrane protein